jgi:hypothetical protein
MALNSSRITPFRNLTINRAFQNSLFLLSASLYILGNVLAVTHLKYSFWWDELTVLGQFESASFFGLHLSHWGNWFPLGRLIFLLETHIFGTAYWAYVLVNATLAVLLVVILGLVIKQIRPTVSVYILYALMISYLMSPGVLYDVQWGFQVAWFASLIFGLCALLVILRNPDSKFSVYLLFTLSFLSFGSINLFLGILFFVAIRHNSKVSEFSDISMVHFSRQVLLFSATLFTVGQLLARLFIPEEAGAQAKPIFMNHSIETIIEIAQQSGASFLAWTLSPVLAYPNSGRAGFQASVDYLSAVSLNLILIMGILFFGKLLNRFRNSKTSSLVHLITGKEWVFLLPSFFFLFLVSFRGFQTLESFDHVRYAPAVLLGPVIFYSLASQSQAPGSKSSLTENLRLVIKISVVLCALSSMSLSKSLLTTNGEAKRIGDSPRQIAIVSKYCWSSPENARVLPGISNDFEAEKLCDIYRETLKKSLFNQISNRR